MKQFLIPFLLFTSPINAKLVTFGWNANPEKNIANYTLKIGTQAGVYNQVIDADLKLQYSVDLAPGNYFVVVEVEDTTGKKNQSSELATVVATDPTPKYVIGDTLSTGTNRVNVRKTPGLTGEFVITESVDSRGVIVAGPEFVDNFIWWTIEWNDETVGWSGEDLLTKIEVIPDPPIPLSPTVRYTIEYSSDLVNWEEAAILIRPRKEKEFVRIRIEK